jgi:hypothetical protein
MRKLTTLAFLLFIISSCSTSQLETEVTGLAASEENSQDEGESAMNEPLLTSEEFLELVSKYEEILGVTVADFDDIDIEDFIEWNNLTEYVFYGFIEGGMIFTAFFNQHVSMLVTRAKDAYLPTELRIVDSTEEEFNQFKEQFFEIIGGEEGVRHHGTAFGLVGRYSFMEREEDEWFSIGRTMHFNQLEEYHGWIFNERDAAGVCIPIDSGMLFGTQIYISKNGKFFISFDNFWPLSIETIQAFMEIED